MTDIITVESYFDNFKNIDYGSSGIILQVQKNNKVKKVKVRTDIQDINYIEILSGLKEGDEVVTSPYNVVSKTLKDSMLVKVVQKSELFEVKKK